ncbi:alpha-E domain-containing protein [Novipirellula sp. SH528]|uniref:alpha-E domain-containing protein n=1 Tax=Novipirellula sp. SH528 TaxID=3454466 RepID=UPI003FA0EB15
MLSRVAESIYWMSRQVERAENLARFLEITLGIVLDQPENLVDPWEPLVQVTGDNEWFAEKYGEANAQNVVQFLAFDPEYHSSMLTSLRCARENAKSVREGLSSEAFLQINEFYHFVNDSVAETITDPTAEFFDVVRQHALFWSGVLDSTMAHDTGWHFANLGRLMERADKTSRILDVKYFNLLPRVDDVGTAVDDLQWSALLLAISGFETYRREHHLMDIEKVVNFFLFHGTFPRSILSCVAGADASLDAIQEVSKSASAGTAKKQMAALRHRMSSTNVKEVLAGGMHQFIDNLQQELNQIGGSLNHDYFNISTTP